MNFATRLGFTHLVYLALMPALAAGILIYEKEIPLNPLIFFFCGTAATGIYIAFLAHYTKLDNQPINTLFKIIDGPLWIIATIIFGGTVAGSIIHGVFIELISTLLGISITICTSPIPTPQQRRGALIAVGLSLLGMLSVLWTYLGTITLPIMTLIGMGGGIVQGTITNFIKPLKSPAGENTENNKKEGIVLVGILAWLAAWFVIGPLWYAFFKG